MYNQLDPLLVLALRQQSVCVDRTNRGLQIGRHIFWLIVSDKAVLSAPFLSAASNPIEIVLFYKPYVNSTCLWKVTPSPPPAAGVIDEEALSGRVSIFKARCKNKITREALIYPSANKIMSLPPTNVLFSAAFPGLLQAFLEEIHGSSPRKRILTLSWKSNDLFS